MAAKVVIDPNTNIGALLVNGQTVRQFRVATGDTTGILYGEKFFTPTGKFKFLSKEATTDTYHPYWMQFDVAENGDAYGLHGPYDQEAFVFPEHEPTKNRGFVSHGCIRVPKRDLSAIAKYLEVGSEIEVLPYRKPGQETSGTKTTFQGIAPDIGEIRAKPLPARMTMAVFNREYPVFQLEPKKSHVLAVDSPKEDPQVVDAVDVDILSRQRKPESIASPGLSERKAPVLDRQREVVAGVDTAPVVRKPSLPFVAALSERKSHVLDRQPPEVAGDVAATPDVRRPSPSFSPLTSMTERKGPVLAERAPTEDAGPIATISPKARFGSNAVSTAMQERKSHVLDRTPPKPESPVAGVDHGTFPARMSRPTVSQVTEAEGLNRPERFTWEMARSMGLSVAALNKAQVNPYMDIDEVVSRLNAAGVRPEVL